MQVALVRGKYLNNYEMQSYAGLTQHINLVGFRSLTSLHNDFPFRTVALPSPLDGVELLSKAGVPSRWSLGFLNRLLVDAHVLVGLEKSLADFDIAHTAETYLGFTQQCLNAKKNGSVQKVICTVWENIAYNHETIRGRKRFKERALQEVDAFVAVTQQAREALIQEGCDPQKISVIYPGIDLNRFTYTAPRKEMRQLLFVGRLVAEKGIWTIWEAFVQLKKKYPQLRLTLCGAGPEKGLLLQKISQTKLQGSVSLISTPYHDMDKLYKQADLLLMPSQTTRFWQEQFGMVLVEALASGVPIVASSSGAILEVVGDAGVVIPEKNSQALVAAVEQLQRSFTKRRDLSLRGRKRAEKLFAAPKTARALLQLYQRVLTV